MRSYSLFVVVFWIIVILMGAAVIQLLIAGESILSVQVLILVGLLIFLVIGDEFVKLRVFADGFEIEQDSTAGIPEQQGPHDRSD